MSGLLWHRLTESDKAKLIPFLPKRWRPPQWDGQAIVVDAIESASSLEKIMRLRPGVYGKDD